MAEPHASTAARAAWAVRGCGGCEENAARRRLFFHHQWRIRRLLSQQRAIDTVEAANCTFPPPTIHLEVRQASKAADLCTGFLAATQTHGVYCSGFRKWAVMYLLFCLSYFSLTGCQEVGRSLWHADRMSGFLSTLCFGCTVSRAEQKRIVLCHRRSAFGQFGVGSSFC